MLNEAEITAGAARLENGKLTAVDRSKLVSVFRLFLADLEGVYEYDFAGKLAELDDTVDDGKPAAQVAACIIEMEALGFGVASKQGGKSGIYYREKDEYWQYVAIALSKLYAIPAEYSTYDWKRRRRLEPRASQTVRTVRRYR